MIVSFGDRATSDLFHGLSSGRTKRVPGQVRSRAIVKLDMLNAARSLEDLKSPPGNRLEALRGNLAGYHSIRINDQWRIVFKWQGSDAYDVKIVDYH